MRFFSKYTVSEVLPISGVEELPKGVVEELPKGVVEESPKGVVNSKIIGDDMSQSLVYYLNKKLLSDDREKIEALQENIITSREDNKLLLDKCKKLHILGLGGTPAALIVKKKFDSQEIAIKEEISQLLRVRDEKERINTLVAEYGIKYPTFKFIPRDLMITIMKKYDLVLGESAWYAKEIPDDALGIIYSFKKEIEESKVVMVLSTDEDEHLTYQTKDRYITMKEHRAQLWGNPEEETLVYSVEVSKFKMIAPVEHFKTPVHLTDFPEIVEWALVANKDTNHLEPWYPQTSEYMDKMKVLDPIACLEVPGGFIVLKAWDEEAEIPEIINNTNN